MAERVIYHISNRPDDNGKRRWAVFIQGRADKQAGEKDKIIKYFPTQQEALDFALSLEKNKEAAGVEATVMLHGLDGKIRKY